MGSRTRLAETAVPYAGRRKPHAAGRALMPVACPVVSMSVARASRRTVGDARFRWWIP